MNTRNLRLQIAYHGGGFAGFQRQPGLRTVQGELERVLAEITQAPTPVMGAGRTDTGVHATGQVVHFATQSGLLPDHLKRALNGLLPPDIAVTRVQEVGSDFHARYSATARRYRYRLLNGQERNPLTADQTYWLPQPLDREAMTAAWHLLPGSRDFTPFTPPGNLKPSRRCEVQAVAVTLEGDELAFEIQANRFLHHMVRALVGTVVQVGRRQMTISRFQEILDATGEGFVGTIAPAHGLCLTEVQYPPEYSWDAVPEPLPAAAGGH